ncbi:hypothetical protein DM02DRAFT_647996 [Periconia macrospinosa]|uniref:Uncharacterized protein n=1 Tax=Periconia macrospinosa TaxID=97972 RepID=A0A2V1EE39_9PLEO|nr:hypothetical protein DM02DRAFT_647996 [Periconia macrospinosa]
MDGRITKDVSNHERRSDSRGKPTTNTRGDHSKVSGTKLSPACEELGKENTRFPSYKPSPVEVIFRGGGSRDHSFSPHSQPIPHNHALTSTPPQLTHNRIRSHEEGDEEYEHSKCGSGEPYSIWANPPRVYRKIAYDVYSKVYDKMNTGGGKIVEGYGRNPY